MSASVEAIRNVAVLGHKGSGKTALVEALSALAHGVPPSDGGKEATLGSRVVRFEWRGTSVNAIDTPGDPSFYADTRLALAVADAVVLVVSGTEGVQPGTERLFQWIEKEKIPCLFAITKIDEAPVSLDDLLGELRTKLHAPCAAMEVLLRESGHVGGVVALKNATLWSGHPEHRSTEPLEVKGEIAKARARLFEEVATTDDALTDRYLTEGTLPEPVFEKGLRSAVARERIVPVFAVSASEEKGLGALLDGLVDLAPSPAAHRSWPGHDGGAAGTIARPPLSDAPVAAFVFKTRIEPHAGRISYARVLSGVLREGAQLLNASQSSAERVAQLRHADDEHALDEAPAGDIVAISKLRVTKTGDTLSDPKEPFALDPPELSALLYSRALITPNQGAAEKALAALQRIAEEDPGLVVGVDESTRELVLSGYGPLHLAIAIERVRERAGVECKLGPPKIAYKETITRPVTHVEGKQKKQSGGHGQYALCYIDIEPLPRGSGFVFEDAVVGGAIPRQFIPSVEKGVLRAMARGVLAGFPQVDVKVRLTDGRAHSVDSSDAAFQVAGSHAFVAAARLAHPALLEPVVRVEITIPEEALGDVLGDLGSRHAKVLGAESSGSAGPAQRDRVVTAFVPLAAMLDYEPSLERMTHGKGSFAITVDHYDVAPAATHERVVRERGFSAEANEG